MSDLDEIYAAGVEERRPKTAQQLQDECMDEAWDELVDAIHDGAFESDDRLAQISTIWQHKGTTAEKYAAISDIFNAMVDHKAAQKMKGK